MCSMGVNFKHMKYRLGLIEDNRPIRTAYETYFNAHREFELVVSEETMEAFLCHVDKGLELDIVLSDIGLPGMSGIDGIARIKRRDAACGDHHEYRL